MLTSAGGRFKDKIRVAQSSSGEKQKSELKKISQEFEAIFIAQLLKVMRETIEESGLTEEGFGKSIYTEMFDQEVSLNIARRGAMGIADLMYRDLLALSSRSGQPESKTSAQEKLLSISQPSAAAADGEKKGTESGQPATTTPVQEKPVSVSPVTTETPDVNSEISDLHLPVKASISSAFGPRIDPISRQVRFHKGLDLAAPEGMKVVSALPGRVITAGYENGYGNSVLVQHSGGVQTRYGHLGSIRVKPGDVVSSDDELGTVGNTGRSTGPHVHFEVIRMGTPVDPLRSAGSNAGALKQGPGYPKAGV